MGASRTFKGKGYHDDMNGIVFKFESLDLDAHTFLVLNTFSDHTCLFVLLSWDFQFDLRGLRERGPATRLTGECSTPTAREEAGEGQHSSLSLFHLQSLKHCATKLV